MTQTEAIEFLKEIFPHLKVRPNKPQGGFGLDSVVYVAVKGKSLGRTLSYSKALIEQAKSNPELRAFLANDPLLKDL